MSVREDTSRRQVGRGHASSRRHVGVRRHVPKTGQAKTGVVVKTRGRAKTLPEDRSGEDTRRREDTCRREDTSRRQVGRRHASSRRHMGGRRQFLKTGLAKLVYSLTRHITPSGLSNPYKGSRHMRYHIGIKLGPAIHGPNIQHPQVPFKRPQIPFNGDHTALNRGTWGLG